MRCHRSPTRKWFLWKFDASCENLASFSRQRHQSCHHKSFKLQDSLIQKRTRKIVAQHIHCYTYLQCSTFIHCTNTDPDMHPRSSNQAVYWQTGFGKMCILVLFTYFPHDTVCCSLTGVRTPNNLADQTSTLFSQILRRMKTTKPKWVIHRNTTKVILPSTTRSIYKKLSYFQIFSTEKQISFVRRKPGVHGGL